MKLHRERVTAELLDPRNDFARTTVSLEMRRDPLFGGSARLLAPGTLPTPHRQDLDALAAETRGDCPFCADRLDEATPRFPPEVVAQGRIRVGEAVLFPNLVPYAKWSSVSVYSPERHRLPIDEITVRLLADNMAAQVTFADVVRAHDPSSSWASINANQLPPSGSSIFHPHLQGSVGPVASHAERVLAELPHGAVEEYVELERHSGERFVASRIGVDWLVSFAPAGIGEVRAFAAAASAEVVAELAAGIVCVLGAYAELGYESFNLALYGAPAKPLTLQLVARACFGPLRRSDVMWSERLHGETATDLAPERLAELVRRRFER